MRSRIFLNVVNGIKKPLGHNLKMTIYKNQNMLLL